MSTGTKVEANAKTVRNMDESMSLDELFSRYSEVKDAVINEAEHSRWKQKVVLIAVSKKQSIDKIEALYRLGHRDFGENYPQELVTKAKEMEERGYGDVRWHLVGHLQTNKVKIVLPYLASIHSVDSEKLASELAKRLAQLSETSQMETRTLPVFIEVNLDAEASKSGFSPDEVLRLAESIGKMKELQLQGLMCIPSPKQDPALAFERLRKLEQECRPLSCGFLSMGMSHDYRIAIQHGATHIRVGTALFGERG